MDAEQIKTVAVIGAGDMGHGIAEVALLAGYEVRLRDVTQELLDRGMTRIDASLQKLVSKGKVSQGQYDAIKGGQLKPCLDLGDAVDGADLVIEAIPEILALKQETFTELDGLAPPHALLASNTSTMRITSIAEATQRPAQVVGLHYFNPAVLMRAVEVIKGEATSEETMQAAVDFCTKCGKLPVRVNKDVPGFIINRVQAPSGVLLGCLVDHGIAKPDEVDAVMRGLGMPMGPFEVMDYTGLDVNCHAGRYFAETVHPDFAPAKALTEKVEAGDLGKKTGKGFFDWSKGRPEFGPAEAADRFDPADLVAVNANEGAKLVEMGVCSFDDIDTAIVNGSGNKVGPMAIIRGMEPADLAARLEGLAEKFSKEIFQPAQTIRDGAYR